MKHKSPDIDKRDRHQIGDMTQSKLKPGMLTYDDGRPYEEQCREISGNASGRRESVINKDTMEAIFKAQARRFPKDMVGSLMWPPAEYTETLSFKDGHIIERIRKNNSALRSAR